MVKGIGLLGGTFDPIHIGHLRSAIEVAQRLDLIQVSLIPNAVPPHRSPPVASGKQRLLMIQLATKYHALLDDEECELVRTGPSYTIETVQLFRQRYPDRPLYWIMGSDAFQQIDSWYQWQQLLSYCHIVVIMRPESRLHLQPNLKEWCQQHQATAQASDDLYGSIMFLELTQLAISSSMIRQILKQQHSAAFLVPEPVLSVIEQLQLYQ